MYYVLLGVLAVMGRLWIVYTIKKIEINAAHERCKDGIRSGRIQTNADVQQEFAHLHMSDSTHFKNIIDLRKWTHAQFFSVRNR